jgi:hypothetical protein
VAICHHYKSARQISSAFIQAKTLRKTSINLIQAITGATKKANVFSFNKPYSTQVFGRVGKAYIRFDWLFSQTVVKEPDIYCAE